MYAFPSPSPREVLKEGRPTGWVGCRERSTFSLMYYLGRYQQLLPLLCSGATSGPGPLFLHSWSFLQPLPPQPCCEVAPQGKQDPCRLSVWTGGRELQCISHCQRPGLLLMCCWGRSQQRLPPPHPGSARDQAASAFHGWAFFPVHVLCCSSYGGEWQLHGVAGTIIISVCVAKTLRHCWFLLTSIISYSLLPGIKWNRQIPTKCFT